MLWIVVTPIFSAPSSVSAQALAEGGPWTLRGQARVGDSALVGGTVVLHQVTAEDQGEIDSVAVATDGAFTFQLPAAPDRLADRFYFASLRHQGILYFGSAVADTAQLDSTYVIQAYDTVAAPAAAESLIVQARNTFFEPNGEEWRVTDIFQLRNDSGRTIVASEGESTWSYPLPAGARDFNAGQDEFSLDGATFGDGRVSVRGAIAPGERVLVFRYAVDEPFGTIPTPGLTEAFDLLIREPSPRVGVEGLDFVGRVELEAGSTYRRFSAASVGPEQVRVVPQVVEGDLPVQWITVLIGLCLAVAALVLLRRDGGRAPSPAVPALDRQALLVEVARLDETFEADPSPSEKDRTMYETRRTELLDRLRASD